MVSTKGRYALRVIIDLAQHESDGFVSLKEISARQGISAKYLEMIVSLLVKGHAVRSQRGKDGGYVLARPADQITVGEIVLLTEGKLAPVSCLECEDNVCEKAASCLTLPMWQRMDRLIVDYLGSVTVQDIVDGKIKSIEGDK